MSRADPLAARPPLASLQGAPEPARAGNILVGTASWTERTLLQSKAFYPPAVKTPTDRLRYYARHFPVVEVDATYYALPSLRNTQAWAERTPADFVFGVKAFATLTGHPLEPKRLARLGYVAGSARGPAGTVFSAAENRAGGTELRWDLPAAIPPGGEGYVSFEAEVR